MIVLACESSTMLGSVALLRDGNVSASRESMRQGSHSDVLNVFIKECLDEANISLKDVDLFATGIGPGSFTGIRISLNSIKTFAYCHHKKVLGLNSLENLAILNSEKLQGHWQGPIVAMINAYKNMVYIATYERLDQGLVAVKPPEVVRVQRLDEYFEKPSVVCGDGYHFYKKYFSESLDSKIVRNFDISDEPHAKILGQFAERNSSIAKHWSELLPLYLRASEAEENLNGIKFEPLGQ